MGGHMKPIKKHWKLWETCGMHGKAMEPVGNQEKSYGTHKKSYDIHMKLHETNGNPQETI